MINIGVDLGELEEAMDIAYSTGAAISERRFLNKVEERLAQRVRTRFGDSIDEYARRNPEGMHHVYEWGQIGEETGRLFRLIETGNNITVEWRPSEKAVPLQAEKQAEESRIGPVYSRHIFVWKAPVQEFNKRSGPIRPGTAFRRIREGASGSNPKFLVVYDDSGRKRLLRRARADYGKTQGNFTAFWYSFWRGTGEQQTQFITNTGQQVINKEVTQLLNTRARAAGMGLSPQGLGRGVTLFSKGRPVKRLRPKIDTGVTRKIRQALLNRWKGV